MRAGFLCSLFCFVYLFVFVFAIQTFFIDTYMDKQESISEVLIFNNELESQMV